MTILALILALQYPIVAQSSCPLDIAGSRTSFDYSSKPPAATVAVDLHNSSASTMHVTELDIGVLDAASPKYHPGAVEQSHDVPVLTRVFKVDDYVRPSSDTFVSVPLTDSPDLMSGSFGVRCTEQDSA
jgi:hypothetical protein